MDRHGEGRCASCSGVPFRFHTNLALALLLAIVVTSGRVRGGEGQTQIIWQNEPIAKLAFWSLQQTNYVTWGLIPSDITLGWRVAAIADFNRDGQPDLLWRSPSSGGNEIWLMNGTNRIARQPLVFSSSVFFEVAGAADFDGDGYPDIVWRDPDSTQTVVWFMDGANWNGRFGWISQPSSFTWTLAATGDFNNDGHADIVWRDRRTGRNYVWLMNGIELLKAIEIQPEPDLDYQLAGVGIFNLLGNTDLLWRHANGQNKVWLMSGTKYLGSAALPTEVSGTWQIAGTSANPNGRLLSAISDEQSKSLTLVWRNGSIQPPAVERRILGETTWELAATNYIPLRFTNSAVTVGQRYEYRVGKDYLLTGIAATPREDRGKIILVVEDSLAKQIGADLELLKADLVGDGWSVIRTNVPRHDDATWSKNIEAIASIKSFITNVYYQDPVRTKAVYLIGHVPIPYSGMSNPDGHGGRALPADIYYGDVDGIYTDFLWNFPRSLDGPHLARHDNLSGDGKFDQGNVPANSKGIAELELAMGRADFADLPSFAALSEAQLTQRYIQKTHRYRHKKLTFPDRVSVATFFPFGPNRESYSEALKIGSRLFGNDPSFVIEGDPFDRNNPALWGILGGLGLPFAIAGSGGSYHLSGQMPYVELEPRIGFANVFASICLDFQYPDNFMRAFLATPTYGLAIMWFKPFTLDGIPLAFEPLGLGEPLGAGFVRSINESQRGSGENMYVTLLGDPALRIQVLTPPDALRKGSEANAPIEWIASSEVGANYFVYRSTNQIDGPWVRLTPNPITENRFADASATPGRKMYQVRAVKLTKTGSGSYTNMSQGVFLDVP